MKTIITKRLVLKELSLDDIVDMYEYAKIPTVGSGAGWSPHVSLEETKSIIKKMIDSNEVLGIYLKDKLIGTIGIHFRNDEYDLGYVLNPNYWNKGYMTEAAKARIQDFFNETTHNVLYGTTFINNLASQKVLKKLGFKYFKQIEKVIENEIKEMYMYKLLKEEFKGE